MTNWLRLFIFVVGTAVLVTYVMTPFDQHYTIKDAYNGYNAISPTQGQAANNSLPAVGANANHDIVIPYLDVTIPWLGDILFFIVTMGSLGLNLLSSMLGYIATILMLPSLFPAFLQPLMGAVVGAMMAITALCMYKLLWPGSD